VFFADYLPAYRFNPFYITVKVVGIMVLPPYLTVDLPGSEWIRGIPIS